MKVEFHHKHQYIEYVAHEDVDDFEEVFGLLSDLPNDEAATVERIRRTLERGEYTADAESTQS